MKYSEKKQDLFNADFNEWTPAHCISSDCKMSAGIAVPMKKRFDLGGLVKIKAAERKHPTCLYYNGVLNLITKAKYWQKPTYTSLKASLNRMKALCETHPISKIVMPKIGSGLDRLAWPKVREIIKELFQETKIEILVCYLR